MIGILTCQLYWQRNSDLICVTYLWSHPQSMSYNSHSSWFKLGHCLFNRHGITVGRLLDGTKMRVCTLIDTGASKPMVNKNFYRKTPFLHSYPIYKINNKPIKITNNNIIKVSECVKIVISFSGHYFDIIAFFGRHD